MARAWGWPPFKLTLVFYGLEITFQGADEGGRHFQNARRGFFVYLGRTKPDGHVNDFRRYSTVVFAHEMGQVKGQVPGCTAEVGHIHGRYSAVTLQGAENDFLFTAEAAEQGGLLAPGLSGDVHGGYIPVTFSMAASMIFSRVSFLVSFFRSRFF